MARGFFFLGEAMADILRAAQSYENLLDVEYQVVLGRKNKQASFSIYFGRLHFYHLAGLHYLKDLADTLRGGRELVFEKILGGAISQAELEKSVHYPEVGDRIACLAHLESLMDSNETVFKYSPRLAAFSAIQADFLMKDRLGARNVFNFLSKDAASGKYFCRSFFPQAERDYSLGQTNWTLLYKKKVRKSSGDEAVLFDRLRR